jgi:hypothetical protein
MKTILNLTTKKQKVTDISPQILVFLNNVLVDELVVAESPSFEIEQDFNFVDGWNEINFIIDDMCWSDLDGSSWTFDINSLTVDGLDKFPVTRGQGLAPFEFKFNPADVVIEVENYDDTTVDSVHYQQLAGKQIITDCSFGFCFKVENGEIVDHYHLGQDLITANDTLNVNTGTFLKLFRMAVKSEAPGVLVDDFIKLINDSTANQYWGLPIVLRKPKNLDVLVNFCMSTPWESTRIYRQYNDNKIPVELLLELLTPPSN